MDMEPPHFVSDVCSTAKGKKSKSLRHGLPPLPKSKMTAQQEQDQDQDQEEDDEQEMAARCLMMLFADGSDRHSNSLTTKSSSESLDPSTLHPIRRRIKRPKRFDVGDADSPYSLEWEDGFKQETMLRLYACKSCNKKFPSFQALGGHRTSCQLRDFKSVFPRLPVQNDEGFKEEASFYRPSSAEAYSRSLGTEIKKERLHKCPVCHRNFTSGQALGGHKRTHSSPPASSTNNSTSLSITEQQNLSAIRSSQALDLNMPAEDENDCIQMQHSSAVSINLGGNLWDSTSWPPYDHKSIFIIPLNLGGWRAISLVMWLVRENEADSQFGSNTGFIRARDLGCKRVIK